MELDQLGRVLLLMGGGLMLLGGLFLLLSRIPIVDRFGRLPGDIRLEGSNFSCFAPITSMFLLSIILTIVVNVILRLVNR